MSEQNTPPPPTFQPEFRQPAYDAAPSPNAAPAMSTGETLTGIFFEPSRTFDALRAQPRFLVALIIIVVMISGFNIAFLQKVGFERFMRAQIETNSRTADLPADQREQIIQRQSSPVVKYISYVAPVIAVLIFAALLAGIYLLCAMAMGGQMNYWQALSVYAYSSFPPVLLLMLGNFILLFVKQLDDSELAGASRGLVQANLGVLVSAKDAPVLHAALQGFDVFSFYGMFLLAVGLQRVARLSSGAAWSVAVGLWIVGVLFRVVAATIFGG